MLRVELVAHAGVLGALPGVEERRFTGAGVDDGQLAGGEVGKLFSGDGGAVVEVGAPGEGVRDVVRVQVGVSGEVL
ncbi:hypothetical protein ACWD5Z_33460, partial [Micromonospora chokoriensis]